MPQSNHLKQQVAIYRLSYLASLSPFIAHATLTGLPVPIKFEYHDHVHILMRHKWVCSTTNLSYKIFMFSVMS